MSPLTEEERKKIIEEERVRADERAKYTQAQPQQNWMHKKRSFGLGSLLLLLIIIGGFSSLVLTSLGNARDAANKARQHADTPSISPVTSPVFDVPALIGKNLTQVEATLGTPSHAPTPLPAYEGKDWNRTWEKDGQSIMVSYDLKSLKVIDYFLSLNGGTGSTAHTNDLLTLGTLKQNDPRYSVEFVSCKNCKEAGQYVGVTVTPK